MAKTATAPLIGYFKAEPSEYVLVHSAGQLLRHGAGLAFWYWGPVTSLASIPLSTIDVPFIFTETTGSFQPVSIQGQLTYRVAEPLVLAQALNFGIDPVTRRHLSNDPEKLPARILNALQARVRAALAGRSLEDALSEAAQLANIALEGLREDAGLEALGIEALGVAVQAVKPTPELAKALEAEYREGLQRRADQAIYARRAAAVEQERRIKENELSNQLALEGQRQALVDLEGQNQTRTAEFQARANEIWLGPWRGTDSRTLLALAFKAMGDNAQRIGTLTITPELLSGLMAAPREG